MTLLLPDRRYYLLLLVLVVPEVSAQDMVFFMDDTEVETKVLEVGIDSIKHLPSASQDEIPEKVHKSFVKYIEYQNGQQYFVEHSKVYLVSGKVLLAHVKKFTNKILQYQDLYTHRVRSISMKKVVAIHYQDEEKVNFMDKINLRGGQFKAGRVIEIQEDVVTFENSARNNRTQNIDVDQIRSIEFKNGFEQKFSLPQPNE